MAIAGASAVTANGDYTPPITEAELQAKLDDDYLYYLGFSPKTTSSSYIGDADPGASYANAQADSSDNRLSALAAAESTFFYPPNMECFSTSVAYVRDTLHIFNDALVTHASIPTLRLVVTAALDGHIKLQGGDVRAEVGAVMRLTDFRGDQYVHTQVWENTTPGEYTYGVTPHVGSLPPGTKTEDALALSVQGPWFVFDPPDDLRDIEFSMTLEMLLFVQVRVGMETPGLAGADFFNTMKTVNIQLLDADNQVVPGFQVVGENGYVYPYNVPEPSTVALFGVGCLGMWFARRKQRS